MVEFDVSPLCKMRVKIMKFSIITKILLDIKNMNIMLNSLVGSMF